MNKIFIALQILTIAVMLFVIRHKEQQFNAKLHSLNKQVESLEYYLKHKIYKSMKENSL